MDEVTFLLFVRQLSFDNLPRCFIVLDNILGLQGAVFRVYGERDADNKTYDFDAIKGGQWHELYRKEGNIFFELNDINGRISRIDGFENFSVALKRTDIVPRRLIDMFKSISELLRADLSFLFGENRGSGKYFNIAYGSNDAGLGVSAGLRDIYWLNYYGKPFVEAIGMHKLRELAVFDFAETESGVFFQTTENVEDAVEVKDSIIEQLGIQYFVPRTKPIKFADSSGFLGLAKHLLAIMRLPKDLGEAAVRPRFD